MSSHAAREWNSVVASPPQITKPPPVSSRHHRPSLQLPPRQTSSSTPSIPCRYTKSEMLAMYVASDRPPTEYQFTIPIVSGECQAPVNNEPPSASEREILESGTWYMPSVRPTASSSLSAKSGRGSTGRPPRSAYSRTRLPISDDGPSPSDYRPTRFSWRQDSSSNNNCPGSSINDAEVSEHRRGSFAEKQLRSAGVGRSDAALSWRRGEDADGATAERSENDSTSFADPAARHPSQHQSSTPEPPVLSRESNAAPELEPKSPLLPDEGLVSQMARLDPMSRDVWWYQDPSGTVRGPFTPDEMRDWYQQSYFQLTLPVRCHPDQAFTPLGALFLQGDPAFLDHVPIVMAAPVEPPRRPPPSPSQPFLPVHHHLQPMPQRLPMFQPQPPPSYYPHSFIAAPPSHQESMFRTPVPFAGTPLGPPVMDRAAVDSWMPRQAPIPDLIGPVRQQTSWMPFANPVPAPTQLHVIDDRIEQRAPDGLFQSIALPDISSNDSSQSLLSQRGIDSFINQSAQADQPPPASPPSAFVPDAFIAQPDAASSSVQTFEATTTREMPELSVQPVPANPAAPTLPSSPVQHNGWVSPSMSSPAPVRSLLDIQREEEELRQAQEQAMKKMQRELQHRESELPPEASPAGPTSPWGSAAAVKPAPRSLLEIQKQEEISLMSKTTQRRPVTTGGWAAKVGPIASSWGSAPKPAALTLRQIQEEEQRVFLQTDPATQPSSEVWNAPGSGSAWSHPGLSVSQAVARPTSSTTVFNAKPVLPPPQSESESDDDLPFWINSKSKLSKSDNGARNEFGGPVMSPEFREWCQRQLSELSSDCDVSLAEFLLTLESSEAICEYIYQYLGRSAKVEAFANGFLQHKDFDDSKLVVQSSRSHVSEKIMNNDSQDLSKKKSRRRRKKKPEYP